ncbi:MAG TPA: UDP-N-acetylmuramoyl-L-alanyl-D-glutamate--2,6-diaminopimelate ligase [Actinomycetota bacterium]|jgi:UDP-N-acetylmuramoyl-L-alanyl-D-glutamate--2,6-diaminopimelate ligase|nr:UDP-N-acetylmuramoyl-L-alanyl-D-glutamate--2,6-diaminopimelate ligase [Actinomycetota bacterium]
MTDAIPRPGARVSSGELLPTPQAVVSEIAAALEHAEMRGDPNVVVSGAAYTSADVRSGDVFFCVRGSHVDGHDFAVDAAAGGAAVLVVERWLDGIGVPQVLVPSVREAMGPASAVLYGRPSESMRMAGVTGTNGKTTTTYLLESIFKAQGWVPGVIGTTGAHVDGKPAPLEHTTPEAPDLHRLLAVMRARGVSAVAMEVSSHALQQHRVGGVRYDAAVFMNLSQDHLDYHEDMQAYFGAKASLFTPAHARLGIVNADNEWARRLLESPSIPMSTFGVHTAADLRATQVRADAHGVVFRAGDVEVRSRLLGAFNVWNCLAALATARSLGIDDAVSAAGIESLAGVPGRVERVDEGQDFLLMVDYAHTPDSIDNVLRAARPLASGRLIVVFGCGGDRDRSKRPLMGRAATAVADLTVITSDNPRSEDPLAIIAQIESGAKDAGGRYVIEPDRRAAIRRALGEATAGDAIVIAGKGHESTQEFADRTIPFLDRNVAAEELRALLGER